MRDNKDLIKKALREIAEEELRQIPPDEEIEFSPSQEYKEQIQQIFDSFGKKKRWQQGRWKIALIAAAAFLALAGTAMAIEPIRTPIIKFFVETYETFTGFRWKEEVESNTPIAPETLETIYIPSEIPEGYEESFSFTELTLFQISWMDPEGNVVDYGQYTISGEMTLDTEGVTLHQTSIQGQDAYWAQKDGYIMVLWAAKGYVFYLCYPETFTEAYFQEVFENLVEQK